jgi:NAD(P)-dependent dehydrogenase (short-subunit alcohol dehydrogenase family)
MSHPTVGAVSPGLRERYFIYLTSLLRQYSAAKTGILGMTRTDALAYAADGIRVNSVLPGLIKTPRKYPVAPTSTLEN